MIVSASVNADVPARHGEWFMRRLDAGYCRVAGADSLRAQRVALTPEAVDGFVFWTRCIEPFVAHLHELRRRGYGFIVQYAITGHPRPLESPKRSVEAAMRDLHDLARQFGARVPVWRYDPVLVTPQTPIEWHEQNFARLARSAAGAADEVVVAFASARRGSDRAAPVGGQQMQPVDEATRGLVKRLASMARECGMKFTLCAQPDLLAPGAAPARCIDARRIADVTGRPIEVGTAGFLPGCLCARAIDIGDRPGSIAECFCGASLPVRNRGTRDLDSEFLFPQIRRFARARGDDLPF